MVTTSASDRVRRGATSNFRLVTVGSIVACVLIAVLASGTAFGAQGSSAAASGVAPNKWWGAVCSNLSSYTKDTAKYEKALEAGLKNPKSISDVKAHLIRFLGNNVSRANELIAALKKAGVPNVPNGAQYAAAVQAGFVELRDGLQGLVGDARAAPTNSRTGMQAAISSLQTKLSTVGTDSANSEDQAAAQFASPQLTAGRQSQKACNTVNP